MLVFGGVTKKQLFPHPFFRCAFIFSTFVSCFFSRLSRLLKDSTSKAMEGGGGESQRFKKKPSWMSQEVSKRLGLVDYNPNISHL